MSFWTVLYRQIRVLIITQHNAIMKDRIRASMLDASIYATLAEHTSDEEKSRQYQRLRDIELDLARRYADSAATAQPRFSISLVLFKIAGRLLKGNFLPRVLRARHRRRLIATSEAIEQENTQEQAIESAEILDLLSDRDADRDEDKHEEFGFLVSDSGALRAAVLGINDGLVSNFSLVMGVSAGADEATVVLLAGLAGLVAGALSMAAGEYVSVVSQRDFYENLVRWERTELILWPEQEVGELAEIFQQRGLDKEEARSVSARIMSDRETALDVHLREELGVDPDDLGGSPWVAAFSSLVAFSCGALLPVIPFLLGAEGSIAITTSAILSAAGLTIVGGGLGWITGTGVFKASIRMLLIGIAAAAITYGIGAIVGAQI